MLIDLVWANDIPTNNITANTVFIFFSFNSLQAKTTFLRHYAAFHHSNRPISADVAHTVCFHSFLNKIEIVSVDRLA